MTFDEYDELFQAMEDTLSKNNNTSGNSTFYTEIKSEADPKDGLEIPRWLIICVPIIAVISGLLLGSTEYFLDVRYTSSLYKAIALPMRSRMNSFAPMLMRSKVSPMEFEGVPVIPSDHRFAADPNSVATL
ncbi:hypothetical protein BGZ79_004233 [Entomortierella chlamydospora]|nr:hypothetical protein BGZ79_004233 [Entomortierella chlamydospora]